MRFTDGGRWWKYTSTLDYALGTSLCYRIASRRANRFRSLQGGEDNQFVGAAFAGGALVTAEAGEQMYAIHAGNTSNRNMGSRWKALST